MDVAATNGVPYLHGNTSQASLDLVKANKEKYRNIFQIDVAETWYGAGFIKFLSNLKAAGWVPPEAQPRRTAPAMVCQIASSCA